MGAAARHDWTVWSCDASVVVTDPRELTEAIAIAKDTIEAVDRACSRFRADSELSLLGSALLGSALPAGAEVSPMLADLVGVALDAARVTDGDVDPTLGNDLIALGYDRDITRLDAEREPALDLGPELASTGADVSVTRARVPGWRRVRLAGSTLTVPGDLLLDLGATAKARAADLAVARAASVLKGGMLLSIGGDLASSGDQPSGGWQILVQDTQADPHQHVSMAPGSAMATSSTQRRRWLAGGRPRHHILDPRFGLPVDSAWRTVTVAAPTCVHANTLSTASIVRGMRAVDWLTSLRAPARLVDKAGRVVTTVGWPDGAADRAFHDG